MYLVWSSSNMYAYQHISMPHIYNQINKIRIKIVCRYVCCVDTFIYALCTYDWVAAWGHDMFHVQCILKSAIFGSLPRAYCPQSRPGHPDVVRQLVRLCQCWKWWQDDRMPICQEDWMRQDETDVTKWLSDWVTEWLSDWVTEWPSDQVTKWLSDQVTKWPSD